MTDTEFKRLLADSDKLSGGFLFCGEEEFIKSRYAETLAAAVVGEDTFSRTVIDGAETTPGEVEAALCTASMFGGRRFVHIRRAAVGAWKDAVLAEYLDIFARAKDDGDLCFVVSVAWGEADMGNLEKNRPSALYKKLTEHLVPVYFGKKGGAQLRKWIERHFLTEGLSVEYGAADTLVEICGQDMFTLSAECAKLVAYAKANGAVTVTSDTVRAVAAAVLTEEAFELSNAILAGDKARALHALYGAKSRREEPIAVMATVSRTIADMLATAVYSRAGLSVGEVAKRLKIHEYKVTLYLRAAPSDLTKLEETLRRCLEADRQLKSSTLGYAAIERLICCG